MADKFDNAIALIKIMQRESKQQDKELKRLRAILVDDAYINAVAVHEDNETLRHELAQVKAELAQYISLNKNHVRVGDTVYCLGYEKVERRRDWDKKHYYDVVVTKLLSWVPPKYRDNRISKERDKGTLCVAEVAFNLSMHKHMNVLVFKTQKEAEQAIQKIIGGENNG